MANLFTMQGRISRQQYVLTTAIVVVVGYAVAFAAGFAAGMLGASEEAGSALGVVIGAAVMRVLYNAINILGIDTTLEFAIIGLVILIGAIVDVLVKRFVALRRAQRQKE